MLVLMLVTFLLMLACVVAFMHRDYMAHYMASARNEHITYNIAMHEPRIMTIYIVCIVPSTI